MCLGCHRKIDGSYLCPNCRWPLCRPSCARSPLHQAECAVFAAKKAVITVPWFDKPCGYYDAILPIRILLLKMSNPKIYKCVFALVVVTDMTKHRNIKKRLFALTLKPCAD